MGRNWASPANTGLGRRFAVVSCARFWSMVVRAASSEWLCCRANSMARSSDRCAAGGGWGVWLVGVGFGCACGGAPAGVCPMALVAREAAAIATGTRRGARGQRTSGFQFHCMARIHSLRASTDSQRGRGVEANNFEKLFVGGRTVRDGTQAAPHVLPLRAFCGRSHSVVELGERRCARGEERRAGDGDQTGDLGGVKALPSAHGSAHTLTLGRRTGYLLAEMADRTVRIGGADMVLHGFNGLADLRGKCQQGQQRRSGG